MQQDLAREIRIIAKLKLRVRLEKLTNAVMSYQQILKTLRSAEKELERSTESLAEFEYHKHNLHDDLGFERLVYNRHRDAENNLKEAQKKLAMASDAFCEISAPATQTILDLLDEHNFDLNIETLRRVLDEEAAEIPSQSDGLGATT